MEISEKEVDRVRSVIFRESLTLDGIVEKTDLPRDKIFLIVNTYPWIREGRGYYRAERKPPYRGIENTCKRNGPPPPRPPVGPRLRKYGPPDLLDEMRAVLSVEENPLTKPYFWRRIVERRKIPIDGTAYRKFSACLKELPYFKKDGNGCYVLKKD